MLQLILLRKKGTSFDTLKQNEFFFQSKFIFLVISFSVDKFLGLLHNEGIRASDAQRHIRNSVKHLEWSLLQKSLRLKAVNYFRKMLHLRCWEGF